MVYLLLSLGIILILVLSYLITYKRQLASLCASIKNMRQMANKEITYRPVKPQETAEMASVGQNSEVERTLAKCGLTVLGDHVEVQPDGTVTGVVRWFVDSSRTICGWHGLIPNRAQKTSVPVMMFFTESSSGQFIITSLGAPKIALASPPNIQRMYCGWGDGLARALEKHRAQAGLGVPGDEVTCRRIENIEDALALFARLRKQKAKWREAQKPEVLMMEDLHSILQNRFETLGPALLKMMSTSRSKRL